MGFLNFLNKRSTDDGRSDRSFSLHNGRAVLTASVTSLRSSNSVPVSRSQAQGHVDILDAQGGIRPYDFRSRVQAAGVRDYGEDVAERNMGENGVDVQSAAAREFYERKSRRSSYSPSVIRCGRDADQYFCGGSIYGGREADVGSTAENWTTRRPLSRLSLEPRDEASGVVAGRPAQSPVLPALQHRGPDRHACTTASSASRRADENWASTGRPAPGTSRSRMRHSHPHHQSRSISPPCIPRYRPQSSMSTKREEEYSHIAAGPRGENRGRRAASMIAMPSSGGDSRPNLSRDEPQPSRMDRSCHADGEFELGSGARPAIHARTAKPRVVAEATPLYQQPEWHNAVRRAVEESLAQLPLSIDLKTLLEMTQNGLMLDRDLAQKVPLRHLPPRQGSFTHSSTPTSMEFSDCASSNAECPQTPRTTTTPIDPLARADARPKAEPRVLDGMSSAGDDYQTFPRIAAVDDYHELESAKLCNDDVRYHSGSTLDYSDVDSFIEKRRQALDEDEGLKFHDGGFSDLGDNLPGLVAHQNPKPCVICHVLTSLHGVPAPSAPCDHNGLMNQKQRLRALGYDYESDESDVVPVKPASAKASRTKKLTSGSGGGLRRLKLVDDCIEEASEEERTGPNMSQHRQNVRRRPKYEPLGRAHWPSIVVREDGNVADTE
ncbi:hypothetical protein E4U41_005722 [Claviceps citrina]|nr:hypothetical protein E4U41_005722 [Claviceps citrina]